MKTSKYVCYLAPCTSCIPTWMRAIHVSCDIGGHLVQGDVTQMRYSVPYLMPQNTHPWNLLFRSAANIYHPKCGQSTEASPERVGLPTASVLRRLQKAHPAGNRAAVVYSFRGDISATSASLLEPPSKPPQCPETENVMHHA